MQYLLNVATTISHLINAALGGSPSVTLSARCYLNRSVKIWGWAEKIINTIFWFDDDHCYQSFRRDLDASESLRSGGS